MALYGLFREEIPESAGKYRYEAVVEEGLCQGGEGLLGKGLL